MEKAARTEKGERRVEGRDHRQVEDNDPGLAAVEQEVLHVDRKPPVGDHADDDGCQQVEEDEAGGDDPGFHQTFFFIVQIRTAIVTT